MLKLDINRPDGQSGIRSLVENAYDRIAGNDDYQRNERSLGLIQICVITVSACATGFVNAFAHKERLGWVGAGILALLLTGFVEKFYFALRHGLTTIYKARKQRLAATLCYRAIQITMLLNAGILCAWVVGTEIPEPLRLWNRWSIAFHFGLALVGVSAVRDADAVVEHRIRKLKAEAIQEDIATIRRAAINDNPLVIAAAKVRGILDGMTLAIQLIRDKPDFPTNDVKQIHDLSLRLYLTGGGERDVTDISGKPRHWWNEAPELEAALQSQASSPAQDKSEGSEQVRSDQDEDTTRVAATGEQSIGVSSDTGEQTVDEQAKESKDLKTVSKAHSTAAQAG
jgi:hypothetical protein